MLAFGEIDLGDLGKGNASRTRKVFENSLKYKFNYAAKAILFYFTTISDDEQTLQSYHVTQATAAP